MSEEGTKEGRNPIEIWLPPMLLKFLVFLVFACVIAGAMIGVLQGDLDSNRLWLLIGGMVALLLLLSVERLTALRVGPEGVEATLAEAQARALEEVSVMEDKEVAKAAREKVLAAKNPAEVEGAMAVALRLNVTQVVARIEQAIREKKKLYVRYMPDPNAPMQAYQVAPLDIKRGTTPKTEMNDYLWVYSYEHGHVLSLRLERVLSVELSEETFDPADVTGEWKEPWNVDRDW